MNSRSCAHGILIAITTMLVLCVAGSSQAASRMYQASLIIHAFGNPNIMPSNTDASQAGLQGGIPLTGNCNTAPFHAQETVTFPTVFPGTVNFTIPQYGGQIPTIDTNSDTIPDVPAGCRPTTNEAGDPLTGFGTLITTGLNTTNDTATTRAASDPRGFTIPKSALVKVKSGATAENYGAYAWERHYLDLRNSNGVTFPGGANGMFGKSLGVMNTAGGGNGVLNAKHGANRSAVGTKGAHAFGGVMKLLGTHFSNEGYLIMGGPNISAAKFTWLFDYLGHGGALMNGKGSVTAGYFGFAGNPGYTLSAGAPFVSNVSVEAWGWTTGMVTVTGMQGPFSTLVTRTGYDNRTGMGGGAIQMVSPMITHWTGVGAITSTAGIGVLTMNVPEPGQWLMLASGVSMLGLLFRSTRK
jgi:hypothetical protein